MSYSEEPALFVQGGAQCVGLLTRPQAPRRTGVLVLVGGPQYRVGSHRQFVLLARALAAAGYAVLRFDFRGMGDSEGEPQPFTQTGADIAAAIACLQQQVPEVQQVLLWGLCDGASAALLYCGQWQDARVCALCLVNPWVRNEAPDSDPAPPVPPLRQYYAYRLRQAAFWRKLLRGGVRPGALLALLRSGAAAWRQGRNARAPGYVQRMASAWQGFSGRIVLVLSEHDLVAQEFWHLARHDARWRAALQHPNLVCHHQPGADHTFSSAALRAALADVTLRYGLELQRP